MQTPSHLIVGLFCLGRKDKPATWPILVGSLLPDAPMFAFYAWQKIAGRPEALIWGELYYREAWQIFFDLFNSIPIAALILLVAWRLKQDKVMLAAGAMILHALADLPLHHDDGHRHFYPLPFRFESPISYWDPHHFGTWVALAETAAVLLMSTWLWRRYPSKWGRGALIVINVLYVAFFLVAYGFGGAADWN